MWVGGGGGPVVATLSLALRMVCVGSSVFVTLGGGLFGGEGGGPVLASLTSVESGVCVCGGGVLWLLLCHLR